MKLKIVTLCTLALAGLMICNYGSGARAQEAEVIAGGEIEYDRYCAVCHGVDAKGQGVMAKYLTVRPTDLTMLRKKNADKFPFWETYGVIDGRKDVLAHGTREMPIWGARFQVAAGGNDRAARAQVMGEILSLVFYLQSLQQ
ncbi:MAG TPA: cytochrome C [Candidatus Binatia bacterium]|jgi:mono/diheme cytochrome c family protein